MPSPFPGMDPYLEGYLWTDVHQALAYEIRRRLTPHLHQRYVARLAITNYVDYDPAPEIGIIYPDIEVLKQRSRQSEPELAGPMPVAVASPSVTEAIDVPAPVFKVRVVSVEIYDVAEHRLVTGIEILSPINKRQPGLKKFQEKYTQLRDGDVHILVIDLLRRGQRPITSSDLPDAPYLVTLTRVGAQVMKAWPIQLDEKLPVVPVPLWSPDRDIPLDLSAVLSTIYDEAAYDLSIDYGDPPPRPPLDEKATVQMNKILGNV
ncbi:DUF4058 family protein [Chloroflexi bacterium TSY]|nr:DUF4058 family protein [Chloroflexi bacterium TSY]